MDVIEADPRLKEIYTTVVKEISIGTISTGRWNGWKVGSLFAVNTGGLSTNGKTNWFTDFTPFLHRLLR